MTIDLYYLLPSAPCRSVMLTAKAIGVELNLILTDLFKGEHLTPEFLKMNPQHCVPVLNDNGFILSESRAISCYLVDKYAKDDSFYPKDPKKRALVNQRLYFSIGTHYQRHYDYYVPIVYLGKDHDPTSFSKMEEAYGFLDTFLEGKTWVAGDHMTIADLDIITTVSTGETSGFNIKKYPNIHRWYTNAKKKIPGYDEINQAGCDEYREIWERATSKKK